MKIKIKKRINNLIKFSIESTLFVLSIFAFPIYCGIMILSLFFALDNYGERCAEVVFVLFIIIPFIILGIADKPGGVIHIKTNKKQIVKGR